jgi:hypothetical protein
VLFLYHLLVVQVFGMEMALTFILVFTIYTVAFELIPKPSPSFKYKADAKGLTLYSVSPQVCCVFARLFVRKFPPPNRHELHYRHCSSLAHASPSG